jgi:hypothetical protein
MVISSKEIGLMVKGKEEVRVAVRVLGTLYYFNGDSYTGDWQDGKKHGEGRG